MIFKLVCGECAGNGLRHRTGERPRIKSVRKSTAYSVRCRSCGGHGFIRSWLPF